MKKFILFISLLFLNISVFAFDTGEKLDSFYEEVFPKFFNIVKENIVPEAKMRCLIKRIKEDGNVNNSEIGAALGAFAMSIGSLTNEEGLSEVFSEANLENLTEMMVKEAIEQGFIKDPVAVEKLGKILHVFDTIMFMGSYGYEVAKKVNFCSTSFINYLTGDPVFSLCLSENVLSKLRCLKKVKEEELREKFETLEETTSFIDDHKLLLKRNMEIWAKKNNKEEVLSFLYSFIFDELKYFEIDPEESDQIYHLFAEPGFCGKWDDELKEMLLNKEFDFYAEILPKLFDIVKENLVSEAEVDSLFDGIKETGKVKDQSISEKLVKIFSSYTYLYGASNTYEIIKKINTPLYEMNCTCNILMDKFIKNPLIDENILSQIVGLETIKDRECEEKIVELFERSDFESNFESSLKEKIENWCKENNNEEALSFLNMFLEKFEEQDKDVINVLFNENSNDDSKLIKDLDETKSIPFYEEIADIFVQEVFLKLNKEEQEQMRSTLKEESIFHEESDNCIEIDESLFLIANAVYTYIMLNQMEFYYSGMFNDFMSNFSEDSALVQKMKDIIKSEMKNYRKDFEFASESFFSRTCSENKISMEAYSSILWEATDKEMNKLKKIILSKLN